jgi:hypothetical protein
MFKLRKLGERSYSFEKKLKLLKGGLIGRHKRLRRISGFANLV